MPKVGYYLNRCVLRAAKLLGSPIHDYKTGRFLGKAILCSFRGRIHLIGYEGPDLIVEFETQSRLTYWRQTIRFTTHSAEVLKDLD